MTPPSPSDAARLLREAVPGPAPRRAALALLLALVASAPFPWGSVQPDALGTGKVVGGAFLVALLTFLSPGIRLRLREAWAPAAAVSGLALLGLVQLLPLPPSLLGAVSPGSAEAWQGAAKVLAAFGRPAPVPRVSLAPWETAGVALLALAFVALFLSAAALLERRATRRLFAGVVVLSGLAQIGVAVSTQEGVLRLSGSFVNPNHLAGYLEVSLALALGLLWYRSRTALRDLAGAPGADERARRLAVLLPGLAAATLLWGVLAAGIVLSQSRGGIVAASGVTLLLVALAFALRGRAASRARVVAAGALSVLLVLGTAFAIAGAGTAAFLRFLLPDASDLAADYRVLIWSGSRDAFALFPWLGSGLGAFREAFRRVQPDDVPGLVDQAHSEYLQILVTGGLAGALLGALALAFGLRALLRGLARQRHREESAFGLAGLGALLMLLLHGTAEFCFSIPAIPATLAAVLGGAWAALQWHQADEPEPEVSSRERAGRRSRRPRSGPPSA